MHLLLYRQDVINDIHNDIKSPSTKTCVPGILTSRGVHTPVKSN